MHQVDEKHIWHEYEDPQYTPADPKKKDNKSKHNTTHKNETTW